MTTPKLTDAEIAELQMMADTMNPGDWLFPPIRRATVRSLLAEVRSHRAGENSAPDPLPPEIVELLRDVASGPVQCTPDIRGRAGAALVRRDLVNGCSRCGGSGYERIGDGSVNAWGACEVCRLTVRVTVGGQTLADLRARVIGRELGASPETCLDVGRAYLASEPKSPSASGENSATATDPGPNEIAGSPPPAECAHYWGDPALRCLLTDGHEGPHAWPEEAIARAREEGRQEGERDTLLAYRYGDGCRCAGGPFVRERPHSDKCRQWIAAMDRHGLLASRGTGGSK